MGTQRTEYQRCIEDIERYRSQRETLYKEIGLLQAKVEEMAARHQPVADLGRQIAEKYEQDEALGTKMHELAILRNLLEP